VVEKRKKSVISLSLEKDAIGQVENTFTLEQMLNIIVGLSIVKKNF
jgi:hypothetical protein